MRKVLSFGSLLVMKLFIISRAPGARASFSSQILSLSIINPDGPMSDV